MTYKRQYNAFAIKETFEDRWRTCVAATDASALGFALAAMFVEDNFKQEAKAAAQVSVGTYVPKNIDSVKTKGGFYRKNILKCTISCI